MYCWPYQLKVWWSHGPTCHTYSALHDTMLYAYMHYVHYSTLIHCILYSTEHDTITHQPWAPGVQGTGGQMPPPRFCEANVKSLNLTIGASPNLNCAPPVLLICPPSFHSHRAPMTSAQKETYKVSFLLFCSHGSCGWRCCVFLNSGGVEKVK